MKIKNITLVEANEEYDIGNPFLRSSCDEALGLEYLAAVLIKAGYNIQVLRQKTISEKDFIKNILQTDPDLVGFLVMACNYPISKRIAKALKDAKSFIVCIFGGAHPSACPDIVSEGGIDFAVIGEGENTIVELVKVLTTGKSLIDVNGISFWDNGLVLTKPRKRIENLDELPFPFRTKKLLEGVIVGNMMYPPMEKQVTASVLYSRGCPFNCSFCDSKNIWGRRSVWRSPESVVGEIKSLKKEFGINTIQFLDLNFNLNPKKVIELCDAMIKSDVNITWYCLASVRNVNKILLEKMYAAGCRKIGWGIESTEDYMLDSIEKEQNFESIRKVLTLSDSLGIINRGFFVIGHPKESKEYFESLIDKVKQLPLDEIRISFLTPFPGTKLYDEVKGYPLTNDWSKFTTDEPVIRNENFSKEELIEMRKRIFKEFINNPAYRQRMKTKIRMLPYLKEPFNKYVKRIEGTFNNQ